MKQDLDLMIDIFISENKVEDQGFSKKVVAAIPKRPAYVWLQDALPALLLGTFLWAAWQYQFFIEQTFFLYKSEFYSWCLEKLGTVSVSISYSTAIGVGVVIAYFLFEKIMDAAESF